MRKPKEKKKRKPKFVEVKRVYETIPVRVKIIGKVIDEGDEIGYLVHLESENIVGVKLAIYGMDEYHMGWVEYPSSIAVIIKEGRLGVTKFNVLEESEMVDLTQEEEKWKEKIYSVKTLEDFEKLLEEASELIKTKSKTKTDC